jgi:PAS domain S-box-containing protein
MHAADSPAMNTQALPGQEHVAALERQRLHAIVESAMDAIIAVDSHQRVMIFNGAASHLLGVRADMCIGEPLARFIPHAYRENHAHQVAGFARDGSTHRSMGHTPTVTALHADGSEIPVEAAISRSGEGEHMMLTVVLRDMRPARAAEQARLAQAQAEAANLAKSRFLARMSHELRTPLNAVLGFAQLMQADQRMPLAAEQAERARSIEKAGWHLLALIDETLDLARIDAGHLSVKPQAVNLDALAVEAQALCATLAHKHGVAVVLETCPQPGACAWVDALHMRQVVLNLLSNAIKYTAPGGQVTLCVQARAQTMVLSVQDTGVGMSAEQLGHLFEPFNRLGQDRSGVDGTGIGLVVTRSLLDAMQGTLDITSRSGVGTTARVTVPRQAAPAA